jgi:plasmid stabilization system protein ParE
MDFQLIWTENAITDLRGIVAYYVHEEKSAASALKVGNAIVERVEIPLWVLPRTALPSLSRDAMSRRLSAPFFMCRAAGRSARHSLLGTHGIARLCLATQYV